MLLVLALRQPTLKVLALTQQHLLHLDVSLYEKVNVFCDEKYIFYACLPFFAVGKQTLAVLFHFNASGFERENIFCIEAYLFVPVFLFLRVRQQNSMFLSCKAKDFNVSRYEIANFFP